MNTTKEKKYLKDNVVTKIFTDESCRDYLIKIISGALKIDFEEISDGFELVDVRINNNLGIKNSKADVVAENNSYLINVEINYNPSKKTDYKNTSYICQLLLRQLKPGSIYKDIKPVYQININNYDFYKRGKFIYRTSLMEEKCHIKRNNLMTIIDINVDFLSEINYYKIKEEANDSLEKLLYIFVCNNKEILEEVYVGDEIMERVKGKLYDLEEDLDNYLWYDAEELRKEALYEAGVEQTKIDVAKEMLDLNMSLEIISKITKLSIEEIINLKNQ